MKHTYMIQQGTSTEPPVHISGKSSGKHLSDLGVTNVCRRRNEAVGGQMGVWLSSCPLLRRVPPAPAWRAHCILGSPSVEKALKGATPFSLSAIARSTLIGYISLSGRARASELGAFGMSGSRQRGNVADISRRGKLDKIDALGRLLTRILRHMASQMNLDMRTDGYVRVRDLLRLSISTAANIPLKSHTVDDLREAVKRDNKQRFSLLEEDGELLIRANQGHSLAVVESESLLKPILSPDQIQVCVHGTYKRSLDSILQSGLKRMKRLHIHFSCGMPMDGGVISGMRKDVNILIFLDVKKALQEGMKLFISENRVILTEGFDGVVPVRFFEQIMTWPGKQPISFLNSLQSA